MGQDKVYHFIIFFIITGAFLTFLRLFRSWKKMFSVSICVFLVFAIISEFIQSIAMSNRIFELYDMLANALGVFAATYLYYIINKERPKWEL